MTPHRNSNCLIARVPINLEAGRRHVGMLSNLHLYLKDAVQTPIPIDSPLASRSALRLFYLIREDHSGMHRKDAVTANKSGQLNDNWTVR